MASALTVTPLAPACTEHGLVAAVRRGSDRAFEELYSRYRGRIGSYIFGMLGDHARAEDIAQEVFISALRRLRDTERPIAFKPWIYEIAKNACIDEFRRTRRVREVPLDASADDGEGDGEGASRGLLSAAPTPDAAVENKQRLQDLQGAFHGLSESHHQIIVMRELEGLSYSQIGERLGMSRPMVESTLFRARKRLGEEYDELVSGRRCERVQSVIAAEGERPLRKLGLRDRRQLARHLSHCQACRRHARMAGVDDSFFQTRGLIGKIAALFPIPWLRWRRSHGDGDAVAATGSHPISALQSLQTAAQLADPGAPTFGLGRAAAAAAALVIAGAGGGLVTGLGGHRGHAPASTVGVVRGAPPAVISTRARSVRAHVGQGAAPARASSLTVGRTHAPAGGSSVAGSGAHAGTAGAAAGTSGAAGGTVSTVGSVASKAAGATGATHAAVSGSGGTGGAGRAVGAVASTIQKASGAVSSGASAGSSALSSLLGGSGSSGSGLPQVPGVHVPNVSQVVNSLPKPALPNVSLPKLPNVSLPALPSVPPLPPVSLPNPSNLLPPLGGHK